jgi:hypothetical protein
MPWSWIIVRVFKAKNGGYPKVNGPTEFFPGDAPPEHSFSKIKNHAHRERLIGEGDTIMQIVPHADELVVEAKVAPKDIDQVASGAVAGGHA